MRESHGGAGLVDVLTPGAGRAKDVDADVLVANLDVDFLIHDWIHEDGGEARVPARLGVERGDSHEAVYAGFRLEESVGVHALDLEHGTLDARFFALAHVEDLDAVPFALGPSGVHAHQHLRPVLRLGAAGTGADLDLRVAEIILPGQQRPQTERFDLRPEHGDLALHLRRQFGIG